MNILHRVIFPIILLLLTQNCFAQIDSIGSTLEQYTSQTIRQSDSMINTGNQVINNTKRSIKNLDSKGDSISQAIQQIPKKYIKQVDQKIDKYTNRITGKTEKTLATLSKWENKIHKLLNKLSPETAEKLFGNNQATFGSLLQKLKEGKTIVANSRAQYDEYRDKLATNLKYLDQQKDKLDAEITKPLADATQKMKALEQDVKNTEAVAQFIKVRKKQLISEAGKYIGKNKYLTKINKESYYYVETLRNYKEIFSDSKKAEQTAKSILNKIPAFTNFMQKNSLLSSFFRVGATDPLDPALQASLVGLQTRAGVNDLIQQQLSSGGPNARQVFQQNIQEGKAQMQALKDKINKAGGSSDDEIPSFKPNTQKPKTFLQRLEYGTNLQPSKTNNLLPATTDIGLSVGYKMNDKSLIGIGLSYKLGLGSIEHIKITHEGIGLRSFIDWKLKMKFYVSGGFEMNYNAQFKNIEQLRNYNGWQSSGLIGISKKMPIKTKFFKASKIQLLYDMFYRDHIPISQPVVLRVGYSIK